MWSRWANTFVGLATSILIYYLQLFIQSWTFWWFHLGTFRDIASTFVLRTACAIAHDINALSNIAGGLRWASAADQLPFNAAIPFISDCHLSQLQVGWFGLILTNRRTFASVFLAASILIQHSYDLIIWTRWWFFRLRRTQFREALA